MKFLTAACLALALAAPVAALRTSRNRYRKAMGPDRKISTMGSRYSDDMMAL